MSLPPPLDNEYIRAAAIASYKASLATAERDEKVAKDEYEAAKRKLDEAANLIIALKFLLAGNGSDMPSLDRNEAAQNNGPDGEEPDNPTEQIAKKRRGGIDKMTLEVLKEAGSGSSRTSDEVFALVANAYPEPISSKSVKNALGEYVKTGQVTKQYSKEHSAYRYGIAEPANGSDAFTEDPIDKAQEALTRKEDVEQPTIDFDQKESATV